MSLAEPEARKSATRAFFIAARACRQVFCGGVQVCRCGVLSALAGLLLAGCAPALPALSGGDTTPLRRTDLTLGAASRVPIGELRSASRTGEPLDCFQPGGLSPLAALRVAPFADADLGLRAMASSVELEGRYGFRLSDSVKLIGALLPYAGWLPWQYRESDQFARGFRYGAQSPWVLALSLGGLYEAWVGARAAGEFAAGDRDADGVKLRAEGLRAGGLMGFGLGFRRLWALAELAADYEWWRVKEGIARHSLRGVSLTPAFALRFRF